MNLTEQMQAVKNAERAGDFEAVERLKQQALASMPKATVRPRYTPEKTFPDWAACRREDYEKLVAAHKKLEQELKVTKSALAQKGEALYQAEHELKRLAKKAEG